MQAVLLFWYQLSLQTVNSALLQSDSKCCDGSAGVNYFDVTLVSEDRHFSDEEVSGFLPGTGTVQSQVQLQLLLW